MCVCNCYTQTHKEYLGVCVTLCSVTRLHFLCYTVSVLHWFMLSLCYTLCVLHLYVQHFCFVSLSECVCYTAMLCVTLCVTLSVLLCLCTTLLCSVCLCYAVCNCVWSRGVGWLCLGGAVWPHGSPEPGCCSPDGRGGPSSALGDAFGAVTPLCSRLESPRQRQAV